MLKYFTEVIKLFYSIALLSFFKFIQQTYFLFRHEGEYWLNSENQKIDSLNYLLQGCTYNFIIFMWNFDRKENFIEKILNSLKLNECGGINKISDSLPKLISIYEQMYTIMESTMVTAYPMFIYIFFKPVFSSIIKNEYKEKISDIVFYTIALVYIIPGYFWNSFNWINTSNYLIIITIAQLIIITLVAVYKLNSLFRHNIKSAFGKLLLAFFLASSLPLFFKIATDVFIAEKVITVCTNIENNN